MKNILLVECNEITADVFKEALSDESKYKLVICDSGYTAFEAVTLKQFDLIIINSDLPYLSGIKTARGIRKKIGFEVSPFIIFLERINEEEVNLFSNVGVAGFLDEPLRPVRIEPLVRGILASWHGESDNIKNNHDFRQKQAMI